MVDYQFVYIFVEIAIATAMLIGFIILLPLSIMKRNTTMIKNKFFTFAIETFLISVLPSIPMFFFIYSRGLTYDTSKKYVFTLIIQIAIFHILFEISGFYNYLFTGIY